MSPNHSRQNAPAPSSDQLAKRLEEQLIRYNNLAMEMEQRMESGDAGQLSEGWSDLDWVNRVDKDMLWIRTSGANSPQFRYMTKDVIDGYDDIAKFMKVFNPLVKRIIDVKTQFTFALDYSITSKTESVQAQIDEIVSDDLNKQAIFDHQPISDADGEVQESGNLFLAIWLTKKQVRAWTSYEIRDIVTDPEDSARPLFYLRAWTDDQGKQYKRAYPSVFAQPEDMPDAKTSLSHLGSSYDIDQDVVVYHMSARKGIRQKFALSELVAVCRWAKPHEKFLEDFAAIVSAVRKYSHMMTTKGSAAQMSAMASQLQGTPTTTGPHGNPVGSAVVAQEGTELKVVDAGSGKIIGIEGARSFLLMVSAASGVPETYLTMDPSTGNLATAKQISPVFIMMTQDRQTMWKNTLTVVFKILLETDDFEVSFPPIRDNINDYFENMKKFVFTPAGAWSGAVKGSDYVRAGYEALEWKAPTNEEIEAMGAVLEETPEPDTTAADRGLTDIARAAQELKEAVRKTKT
jgi:hypothetical protein